MVSNRSSSSGQAPCEEESIPKLELYGPEQELELAWEVLQHVVSGATRCLLVLSEGENLSGGTVILPVLVFLVEARALRLEVIISKLKDNNVEYRNSK